MIRKIAPPADKRLILVCCQHGDERFGLRLFQWFGNRLKEFPGLELILANPAAVKKNRRFIDQDLNRAYPGSPRGDREARLATKICHAVRGADFVLDIHTTTSPTRMTPIVARIGSATKKIINLCDSKEAVMMTGPAADHALIGCAPAVSMEFNAGFARRAAARQMVVAAIRGLLAGRARPARPRDIFTVAGTIPLGKKVRNGRNFRYSPELGGYPFLIGERAYRGLHQGFLLRRQNTMKI